MLGRTLAAAAGLTLTAALTTPAAAQAAPSATVPCAVEAASATTAGDHFRAYIEATKPIKRSDLRPARGTLNLPVRYYADWWLNPDADWNTRGLGGYLVAGDVLYDSRR